MWQDSKRLSPNRRRGDSKNYKSLLVRRTNERNCDKEKASPCWIIVKGHHFTLDGSEKRKLK